MANLPGPVTAMGPPAMGPPATTTLAVKPDEPWTENLTMRVMCKDCKEDPPNVVEDFSAGDMICGSCGLILGDRIVDTRSEWRTFTNDDQNNDDPSRVGDGANPLLNGAQLQTSIAFGGGAAAKTRDLSRAQNKVNNDKSTKTLLAAYKQIGAFCDGMSTSKSVSDTSKHLFKIVHDESAFRGKSQDSLIAACIFIACRQCKVARTFREVQDVTKVSKAEIGRAFKYLEKFFAARNEKMKAAVVEAGGVFNPDGAGYDNVESTTPKDLCTRFCNLLDLSQKCTRLSQEVAAKTEMSGILAGRSPISTAAACIYMASYLAGEPKSAKDVAIVAGVSDGTIRNAYKIMFGEKEKLVRKDWTAQGKVDLKRLPPA